MTALDPVPRPIDHVLRGAPGDVALIDRAGVWTYAELEAAVGAAAGWLAGQGLRPGDRVASWLPKTRAACVLPLAVARAGLVYVPINPLLKPAQIAHILADSGAALLVTQHARAGVLEVGDVPEGCRVIEEGEVPLVTACTRPVALPRRRPGPSCDGLESGGTRLNRAETGPRPSPGKDEEEGEGKNDGEGGDGNDYLAPSNAQPDTLAAILYTSGSTGFPKGVMLSHANLWLGAIAVAHYLKLTPADRVLAVLPLSFDYGQNQLFSTWAAGASVALLDYLTAADMVKAIERVRATTLAGVPPLWVQLLEASWPTATALRLNRLTNSGGALTPGLVRGLRTRFPAADVYAMYGLTEAFRSTYLDPSLIDAHPDAMGRAIPFAEVLVVRADGTRAAPGEAGELVHCGPLVAQGYWRDPERTAARFRPAPAFAQQQGRAVWSGDTVIEGVDGLLRFVAREDEMIKSAGNRISPTEVEAAIVAGGEAREAVAVGVADERLGQAIVAVVAGDAAGEAALRARLKAMLPSFMQPVRYEWHLELPRNANGKLDRAAIAAAVRA